MAAGQAASPLRIALTFFAFVGCESRPSEQDRAESGPEQWRLPDSPAVSIGVVDGDERYQFVGISGAWRQADGRIVVLDRGRPALLFYDSAGGYLHQTGRRGEGPGEMSVIVRAWPYRGDSIATFDLALRRMSIFDGDGVFARSFQSPVTWSRRPGIVPSQSCCSIGGTFADGSFVGHPPDDIPNEPGPDRFTLFTPVRVSADGSRVDTIATFESALTYYDAAAPSRILHYATSYYFRYVVVGNRLIGGNGLGDGLVVVTLSGDPADATARPSFAFDTIPYLHPPRPFDADLRERFEEALRADYEQRRGRYYEGTLESNLPGRYAEFAPHFVNTASDAAGRVWLQRWTPEYGRLGARNRYDIITQDGEHVAVIDLPEDARLLWADESEVILLERDSLDVQYVRVYDIVSDGPVRATPDTAAN